MSLMSNSRLRTKESRVPYQNSIESDGKITLGAFRDKASGSINFVPWERWDISPLYNTQRYQPASLIATYQATLDELHLGPLRFRTGGDFRSLKFALSPLPSNGVFGKGTYYNVNKTRRYEGGFYPPQFSEFWGSWMPSMDSLIASYGGITSTGSGWFPPINDWGHKGWRRTKPKLESAGAYVFLREAKDIPRMLVTTKSLAKDFSESWEGLRGKFLETVKGNKGVTRTNKQGWKQSPKKASDQFLNQQFGWSPFLNDLKQFNSTYQNGKQYIERLIDRNNRFVRRRVPLADWTDTTLLRQGQFAGNPTDGYVLPIFPVSFPGDFFVSPPSFMVEEEIHHQISAVGKFKFYNPIFNVSYVGGVAQPATAWETVMRYITIYGLRPTPSNIYKAIPWTWLIDWFVDFSQYLDYLNDIIVDQVACEYFYVMYHRELKRNYYIALPFADGTMNLKFTLNVETKERKGAASPFDFALDWESLSPRQLAILAALKISH